MDISNDGKQAALTARGDVFLLSLGDKETVARNLTGTGRTRETCGRISPDGKSVAFFSDRGGVMQFYKYWRAFRYKKGVIIDVRGNSGGWTEYFLIDKLERQQVANNVLRGMEPYRYPNPASRAHSVLVSNEDNGSDGEAFVEHFRARKLGTIVGVPSWGGLVGTVNAQRTIDNGTVVQSNNAFYGREGKWWVENHGADPDVYQDNDPASVVEGRDLQLEKALDVARKKIKEEPRDFPPVPSYPKK